MSDPDFTRSFAELREDAGKAACITGLVMEATTRRESRRSSPTWRFVLLIWRGLLPVALLTLTIWVSCSGFSLVCQHLDRSFASPAIQVVTAPSTAIEGEQRPALVVGVLTFLALLSDCTARFATALLVLGFLFATVGSELPSDPLDEVMEAQR
jgi:hypothetical protein